MQHFDIFFHIFGKIFYKLNYKPYKIDFFQKKAYNTFSNICGGIFMEKVTLFTHILPEEIEKMRLCFGASEAVYQNNSTIMEYSHSMRKIGLILEGQALLCCCDIDGNEYIIEDLKADSVFGEPFLLPNDTLHYYVRAKCRTRVLFIDYAHVIKRCPNACGHHSQLVSNLLQMVALKSSQQTNRIYVLSRTSIQKKLLAYLNSLASNKPCEAVTIPMSYTDLAQYLGVDRSAMMREFKHLCDENIIQKNGRTIQLCTTS